MSAMANTTHIVTTVTKTATKEKVPKETNAAPRVNIQDFCEEHYEDILPVIMDKIRREKRKEVHTRLDFGDNTKRSRRMRESSQNSSTGTWSARHRNPSEMPRVKDCSRHGDGNIFGRLGHRRQSAFNRLSDTYLPSTTKSGPDRTSSRDHSQSRGRPYKWDSPRSRGHFRSKDHSRGVEESYDNTYFSYRTESRHGHRSHDRGRSPAPATEDAGNQRQRGRSLDEEDLAVPWTCEEVDPFTPRIRNFKSSRKTRMPNNVKTYDGTGDPEDHVKKFQAAAQVERWAMPTWCHMFNSTLIGTARVWFDELPPESIDGYKDLKAAFLAYFMQQKKYVKDPVEIHNIKQRDGETLEDFMERFKVETGRMKGAPECMRISGFMHGVNNPELTKRLNEHVPKTMEEMMTVTTAFIRGETAAASKKKGHAPWKPQDQSKRHVSERKSDFRGKFKPPPPMVTPVEKRSSSKFCDFHNDKGHNTDECMQLKKQIEELVRAGKLSHLIKEIKQGRDQTKNGKKEALAKDKSFAIYMIQPWHRMTRQKVTQSFARVNEITFPPLTNSYGTEGPLVIEAEINGHMIYRISTSEFPVSRNSNRRNAIRKRTNGTMLNPEGKLGHIRMAAIRHDRSTAISSRTSARYPGRIYTCSTEEKGLGPRTLQSHPSRSAETSRSGDHERSPLSRLAIQSSHGDCYPIHEIDWKVESLCGYPFKCFLDAYKGYHQIQMAESDEEKTAFHTSQGVYCYTKMPFGLKNAGATYQRLVDKAFNSQVGQNVEVYVDDLVIKSYTEAEMLRDVDETFRTPEGIKPCPDKTEVVLQLPSPRTIKEVQSLNGKLASLNRFLSKSAEKSLPLFKTLKKCIKKSDFHWTPEAEQAFKQLKQHLLPKTVMSSSPHSTIVPSDSDANDAIPPPQISSPKDTETPISPSSSVGSSSPVRSTTPPPDYFFDKSIFAKLDNLLWIIRRPLGSKPVLEKPDESDTCYNVHL
ncbi:reverse transcriptase domain-containing protein [Tanacetum coccineum]